MSSEELNEAVLLETALFGDMSDQTSHLSSFPDRQHSPVRTADPTVQCLPTPTSESLTATRLLREQQVLNSCLQWLLLCLCVQCS